MSDQKESLLKRKCTTPKFRASYANVFVPTAIEEGKDKKFNITMLFDKDDDLTTMRRAVRYAAIEAWGKDKTKWPRKRKMPFRDGDEDKPDNPEYVGKIFVYASCKLDKKPQVIDQRKKPITVDSGDFYSGCYARATLIAFHYKTAGNEGISFVLLNVQKWADGEKLAGKRDAANDFDDSLEDEIEDIDDDADADDDSDDGDDDDMGL